MVRVVGLASRASRLYIYVYMNNNKTQTEGGVQETDSPVVVR